MHVADVDKIGCTHSVQSVRRRFMEEPPAPGKGRASEPGVEHEAPLSQLQLHAGMAQVSYLKRKRHLYYCCHGDGVQFVGLVYVSIGFRQHGGYDLVIG